MTDELLASVLDAHGGAENWKKLTTLTARLSLGGPSWTARGWPDVDTDQTVTLDPHREHITFGRSVGLTGFRFLTWTPSE